MFVLGKRGFCIVVFLLATFYFSPAFSQFESNSLSQAVDNTRADFFTESPAFFRQTRVSTTGGDSAQSGNVGDDGVTVMGVQVQGPTTISFDWSVSSEEDFDFLAFVLLDQNFDSTGVVEAISGNRGFRNVTIQIPAGIFFPSWGFLKDGSVSSGADAGWVDNVVIGNLVEVDDDDPDGNVIVTPSIKILLLDD